MKSPKGELKAENFLKSGATQSASVPQLTEQTTESSRRNRSETEMADLKRTLEELKRDVRGEFRKLKEKMEKQGGSRKEAGDRISGRKRKQEDEKGQDEGRKLARERLRRDWQKERREEEKEENNNIDEEEDDKVEREENDRIKKGLAAAIRRGSKAMGYTLRSS